MKTIYVNQVGYKNNKEKKAYLNFEGKSVSLVDETGKTVYEGVANKCIKDDISGEEISVFDFSDVTKAGKYKVASDGVESVSFQVSEKVNDKLLKDLCKCYYYLRCGVDLEEKYAGPYVHGKCHTKKAKVFGEEEPEVDVTGGWHDAGDYGRYATAGAVAVAHLLYAFKLYPILKTLSFDIPKDDKYPDLLTEVKVELDFLMKLQRKDGGVYHKVTTMRHADFIMPEEDTNDLFLFPVSSLATADVAAVLALGYSVYKEYDKDYALKLLNASLKSYEWLAKNKEAVLFKNPQESNTGEYGESEDFSNRFWTACSLFEATGEDKYYKEALKQKDNLITYDKSEGDKSYIGNIFSCFGWMDVAGLGVLSMLLLNKENDLKTFLKEQMLLEAKRLEAVSLNNGFSLCMDKKDFIWGSNMELGKYLMVLLVSYRITKNEEFLSLVRDGLNYLLGCNTMDVSYVTGAGEKAFKNPHLRPTAVDNVDEPWDGLVSGGPNVGLQDERAAATIEKGTAPMKCYLDHVDCYSLNEITIYWNSPFVFAVAGLEEAD
ncbi:MAG: glycoside hydrolase family 9 protein [Lachnospiraceae bacterium]|nr:glycoside hydrolase family 9 protein [Lachnospiraceae bacterium]